MSATFQVTLVNLSEDGGAVPAGAARVHRHNVGAEEMRRLLENFSQLDPLENAVAEPEIRVQSGGQSCVLRAGHRTLVLYDMLDRAAPGHAVTAEEAMAELDGTALLARTAPTYVQALATGALPTTAPKPAAPSAAPRSRRTMAVLAAAALLLSGGIAAIRISRPDDPPPRVAPLPPEEETAARRELAGVYLTGTQAGDHGIVISATGEMRLFEFRATEPPRIVHATGRVGRMGRGLCLATDQPGGVIQVQGPTVLRYCGETYTRAD